MTLVCPRCVQGAVVRYEHDELDTAFLMCEECEAAWQPDEPVDRDRFRDVGVLLATYGLDEDWSKLRRVPPKRSEGPEGDPHHGGH